MGLNHLFETYQIKPPAAPPTPSPQTHSFPTPCTQTRTPWSTSPLLITVKEASSPWGQGRSQGLAPRNCASVSQAQEMQWPDPSPRVGWTGPAVCRWNTATTPVMPCCSVTVGTVGCPLSGMHQSVTPPVPSFHFLVCCMKFHSAGTAAVVAPTAVHGSAVLTAANSELTLVSVYFKCSELW